MSAEGETCTLAKNNGNSDNGKDAHALLTDVITNANHSACQAMYNKWATDYEKDMIEVKYFGPTELMKHFDRLNMPKEAKILDVCAGTGGIGRELVKRGYSDLHAIDGAECMLDKAKAEGNYKTYTCLLFEPDSKLPYDDNTFDCVLLAGGFAPGHLPIVALREVCRVTKVGGKVSFICCDPKYYEKQGSDKQYADNGFYKLVDELRDNGIWKEHEGFPIPVPYIEYSDGFVMAFEIVGPK